MVLAFCGEVSSVRLVLSWRLLRDLGSVYGSLNPQSEIRNLQWLPVDSFVTPALHAIGRIRPTGRPNPLGPRDRITCKCIRPGVACVETIIISQFRLLEIGVVLRRTHGRFLGEIGLWFLVCGAWFSVLSAHLIALHAVRA